MASTWSSMLYDVVALGDMQAAVQHRDVVFVAEIFANNVI